MIKTIEKIKNSNLIQNAKKYDYYPIIEKILVFLGFFALQMLFLGDAFFDSDEGDIFIGGQSIASGLVLYKEFFSQHMPVSYFISAFFYIIGAKGIYAQRIAFYLFFALFWTVTVYKYKDTVPKRALIFYPVIFNCLTSVYFRGKCVLSEHIAGIGFVILLLEYWAFLKSHSLKWHNCLMISVSILFTFGTIFVAAYSVFVIVLAVFITEIIYQVNSKYKFKEAAVNILKKFYPVAIWCISPWILIVLYFILNGALGVAFYSAYTMNRTVYSKYNGGLGSSIFEATLTTVDANLEVLRGLFSPASWSISTLSMAAAFVLAIVFIIYYFRVAGRLQGTVLLVYILLLGVRGTYNFHGTQWVAVIALLAAITVFTVFIKCSEKYKNITFSRQVMIGVIILSFSLNWALPFTSRIDDAKYAMGKLDTDRFSEYEVLNIITDENEAVWQLQIATNTAVINSDRPSAYQISGVPWFWDAFGLDYLEQNGITPPRVALFSPDNIVWSYNLRDYAPELIEYMNANYTKYENTNIWIKNDYYAEALEKISITLGGVYETLGGYLNYVGPMLNIDEYEQRVIITDEMISGKKLTGISFYLATYMRANNCKITLQVLKDDREITSVTVDARDFENMAYNEFIFKKPVEIESGEYVLKLTCTGVNTELNNCISFMEYLESYTGISEYMINGEKREGTLVFRILAK